ncbi:MAG TPA: hypothetical protein PKY30_16795 [Myxococcota bacterium]|nr:hypothetical protein [Myxococcota bacterium]
MPPFNTAWDEAAYFGGPASIFVMDHKGWLKVDPERSREMWLLLGPLRHEEARHYVLTDHRTGLKMYLCVTHPDLAEKQPKGSVVRYPTAEEAIAVVEGQWVLPASPLATAPPPP